MEKRVFKTGALRDTEKNKIDYEGHISPIVLQAFGEYMNKHRTMKDGSTRGSDNWQKGQPKDVYMKSATRHFMDLWLEHRGYKSRDGLEDALMGLLFNTMGYIYEIKRSSLKRKEGNKHV